MFDLGGSRVEDQRVAHSVDVSPQTGGASLRVPIPTSPGRSGFSPDLSLVYRTGRGDSAFGAGWVLSGLPSVGIDTRRHVPRWDGTDTYQLSGDELVPWVDSAGDERGTIAAEWTVAFLRSRRSEISVRVERWVHVSTGRVHFRTRDAANVVTVFGARPGSIARVQDPEDAARTLVWLPEVQVDPHGNAMWFEYAAETLDGVELAAPFEPRSPSLAQRYLKRIRYGNSVPLSLTDEVLGGALPAHRWCFEVVLDYGDHGGDSVAPDRPWVARPDPVSSYRGGFPIRMHRLCRRILMCHDFPDLGAGPTLVTALELAHDLDASGSGLREIARVGYRRDGSSRRVPPLRMTYAPALTETTGAEASSQFVDVPGGFFEPNHAFVDLYGEGLAGILTEVERAWYYKRNLGNGAFGDQTLVRERPATSIGAFVLADLDRDGNTELLRASGRQAGRFELDREEGTWSAFRPFAEMPHVEALGGRAQWIDLNGDGRPDLVIARGDSLTWFASDGDGFKPAVEIPNPLPDDRGLIVAADRLQFAFADMTGGGLADLVRVRNGSVEYWPSLGNGRFGERVVMEGVPQFAPEHEFDSARIRFVDLDGSGTSDIVYLGSGEVTSWINGSGNRFLSGPRFSGLPTFDHLSNVRILDFYGDGRACLVWSTPLQGRESPVGVIPLTPKIRPRLLLEVDNSLGAITRLEYASSAEHYLRDLATGRGWSTRLPSHSVVVERREVIDEISGGRAVTRFAYHDGYFDGVEREMRGFGQVDTYDVDQLQAADDPQGAAFAAPSLTRTWFHLGTAMWNHHRPTDTYGGDPDLPALPPHVVANADRLTPDEIDDGLRSLAGRLIRRETYAVDDNDAPEGDPFELAQFTYELRCVQPARGDARPAFRVNQQESATWLYERVARDPRVAHQIVVDSDEWGVPRRTAELNYARRSTAPPDVAAQGRTWISIHDHEVVHFDEPERFELAVSFESRRMELVGIPVSASGLVILAALQAPAVLAALASPEASHVEIPTDPATEVRARLLGWDRSYYWDSNRGAALPLGSVGAPCLVHHEEAACFAGELVDQVYGDRVDATALAQAGYVSRDGLWWQVDHTHLFGPATEFSLRTELVRGDGGRTIYSADTDRLTVVSVTDVLGNVTRAGIDYHLVAPWRVIDANGNISEVRYDALGVVSAGAAYGHVNSEPWGQAALAAPTTGTATIGDVLAAPAAHLGGAQSLLCYDLDAWSRDRAPTTVLQLVRETLAHDGTGASTVPGRIQTSLRYVDGFGRPLQEKALVDPGMAIERDATGQIVVDAGGRPLLAPAATRWLASGHVVYDAKQRPSRRYEPFFTTTPAFEADAILQTIGAATLTRYDVVGRAVVEEYPDGTFSRTTYGAWTVTAEDRNDTVANSVYRSLREGAPQDSPERAAYESAASHADTPVVAFLDPLGRQSGGVARGGGSAADRRTETELDLAGNPLRIVDPRGLVAFSYRYDMAGRRLHDLSVDAGESRTFPDAYDRVATTWDARGYRIDREYDLADRPVSTHVRGGGLDHRVEQRVYGDTLADRADAARRNLLGRLVTSRDAGGELTIGFYDPRGQPMRAERRLRTAVDTEPDYQSNVALEADQLVATSVYDALGRARSESVPDGSSRSYAYSAQGHVERILVTLPDGTLVDAPVLQAAEAGARGQALLTTLGNGVRLEYAYDRDTARLTTQRTTRGSRVLQDITYTHDPVGNLVRLTDGAHEGPNAIVRGTAISARRNYRYDAHYRLRSATGRVHQSLLPNDYVPNGHISLNNGAALERFTRSYDYDASGNLTAIRHAGATHSWRTDFWISDTSNRSLPALDQNGNAIVAPEQAFDAGGNLVSQAHLRRVDWNWRGELSRAVLIERPSGTDDDESYVYGADGGRVRRITTRVVHGGQTEVTEKVYLGHSERKRIIRDGSVIFERWTTHVHDASGRIATIHRWVRDDLAREVEALGTPRIHYSLTTHQGSSALELDQTGDLISYEEYFPHGGTAFIAGDRAREVQLKEYRYSGKERDDATGLYYYGYRYLAPWLGRWMSPDPIGPEDDLNLYQFVLGDPVGNVDENGLDTTVRYRTGAPVVADPAKDWVGAERAQLSATMSAGAVRDYDALSPQDQLSVAKGEKVFVRSGEPGAKGPYSALSQDDFEKHWLPKWEQWAKDNNTHINIHLTSRNPSVLPDDGAQHGAVYRPATEGAPPDPWDSGAAGAAAHAGKDDGKDEKDETTGTGESGSGTGDGRDAEEGSGDGGGEGSAKGSGNGRGDVGSTGRVFVTAGIEGGLDRGVVGGTPYSEGTRQGGQGRSVDASAPLGGGPGLARGHDKAGNSGGSNHDGTIPGGGDREGLSQIKPSEFAKGLGEDTSAHHGKGPGGATREGKPAPRANNWKDVALDVAGILSFAGNDEDGHDDGVPGGLGWGNFGSSALQWLYVATSFLDFLGFAINGLGQTVADLFQLFRGVLRFGWWLLANPPLFRLGARLIARWGSAILRMRPSVQRLASSARWALTGVARFDQLVVGTRQFAKWKANLLRRGFRVIEQALGHGTMADIEAAEGGGHLMRVDPAQFTYLGMLHESRHVRQIEKALANAQKPFNAAWLRFYELGAYQYELRLGKRFGFSATSMNEITGRLNYYLRKIQAKMAKDPTFRDAWK